MYHYKQTETNRNKPNLTETMSTISINPIATINPTWHPIVTVNEIIDDYFVPINKYQDSKTTKTTQDDTTYHKDNIIDPFIIPRECESDHIINDGWVRHIQTVEYQFNRTEYKYETRKGNSRFNPGKIQRQKGYLKQPGGASCDQRR